MGSSNSFVIVSTPIMHEVADRVVNLLKAKYEMEMGHHRVEVTRFANGEVLTRIPETVRREHVFFFHAMQYPSPNDAVMTMLIANDALMRGSASGITNVVPYIPYLRQDRKDKPRVPITARMLADLIESNASVRQMITVDMHADQEQGFFSIPVDNLTTTTLFADYIKEQLGGDLVDVMVVSPDFGGAVRSRRFAGKLGVPVGIVEKRRPQANVSEVVSIIGEPVTGKTILIFDDMIDTGGSIRGVVSALMKLGAKEVMVYTTHGIFSGSAIAGFTQSKFLVHCTNSIPRDPEFLTANASWLVQVPIDELLADAVYQATLMGGSISKLNH